MAKLSRWLLGYRKISCRDGEVVKAVSVILKNGISAEFVSGNEFLISERDYSRIKHDLDERVACDASEILGVFGKIKVIEHKVAIAVAMVVSILLIFLASDTVWDIRVENAGGFLEREVIYALNECGLRIGNSWSYIDNSDIEVAFLNKFPKVAWININRRGMVAYISVAIKDGDDEGADIVRPKYANIVAEVDCVIEDISVTSGMAVVSVGDTVKAGDILISGITSEECGEFCRAEGIVSGRVVDSVSVEVKKEYSETVEIKEELCALSIKIFNFKTNIFKFYSNLADKCDIIEDKVGVSLFGEADLPVEIISTYKIGSRVMNKTLSTADMVRIASRRLNAAVASHVSNADLISISTEGAFSPDGYTMKSKIVYLASIGIHAEFEVN